MKETKTKREFSAGGVVFKKKGRELLWLLIKPKGSKEWCFPKGDVNRGENSVAAAKREVIEEAGIETQVIDKAGEIKFFFTEKKQKIFKVVVFYLMEYLAKDGQINTKEVEKTTWLSSVAARKKLAFKKEKELLDQALKVFKGRD